MTAEVPDHSQRHLTGLPLARAVVDRDAVRRTDPAWLDAAWADPRTRVLRLRGDRAAVVGSPPRLALDTRPQVGLEARVFLGSAQGVAYFAALEPDPAVPAADAADKPGGSTATYLGLREVAAQLGDRDAGLLVHAVALANWHATHPRCSRCGAPTRPDLAGHLRRCDVDGSEHYPRTDPAVIMQVVDDDDRLLLGRQPGWGEARFSTLAGFVEPGESLEAAVRREVREEVGLAVDTVGYLGSQPWPFPASLMVGFTAHVRDTDVTLHDGEIAQVRWYTRAGLAADLRTGRLLLPAGVSISRRLVEHWYGAALPAVPPG